MDENEIEQIAERAAAKALEKVYAEVGKSIVSKLFYIVGAIAIGLFLWLKAKGII